MWRKRDLDADKGRETNTSWQKRPRRYEKRPRRYGKGRTHQTDTWWKGQTREGHMRPTHREKDLKQVCPMCWCWSYVSVSWMTCWSHVSVSWMTKDRLVSGLHVIRETDTWDQHQHIVIYICVCIHISLYDVLVSCVRLYVYNMSYICIHRRTHETNTNTSWYTYMYVYIYRTDKRRTHETNTSYKGQTWKGQTTCHPRQDYMDTPCPCNPPIHVIADGRGIDDRSLFITSRSLLSWCVGFSSFNVH